MADKNTSETPEVSLLRAGICLQSESRSMMPPFRRDWSIRLGRLRLFSVPWSWDWVRERLTGWAAGRTTAPPRRTHQHYCEWCDGHWPHEGQMCAQQWAWQCPACRPPKTQERILRRDGYDA